MSHPTPVKYKEERLFTDRLRLSVRIDIARVVVS